MGQVKPKALTSEAIQAVRAESGPLYGALIQAYVTEGRPPRAEPPDEEDAENDEIEAKVRLEFFAAPPHVTAIYCFYRKTLPATVTVDGNSVRILEPDDEIDQRVWAFGAFERLFGGERDWIEFAHAHTTRGGSREKLEQLAVRWLFTGQDGDGFFEECKRVPGFAERLGKVIYARTGNFHVLEGYKQLRAQFAREGGDASEMDALMLAAEQGDDVRVQELQRKFAAKYGGRRGGCLNVMFCLVFLVAAVLWAVGV